jgi:hypothetical protein
MFMWVKKEVISLALQDGMEEGKEELIYTHKCNMVEVAGGQPI